MAVGRRGVFFTLTTHILIVFLVAYQRVSTAAETPHNADEEVARMRISVMDNYIETFDQHATASLRSAGYYTLQNLSANVRVTGNYTTDMNKSVRDCLLQNPSPCLRQNQTLNNSLWLLTNMTQDNMNINTIYSIDDVWVSEERPFEVVFWMNISYNVSDPMASWQVHKTIKSPVAVFGIEDPLFNHGMYINDVNHTRVFKKRDVPGYAFNNTSFYDYYINEQYIEFSSTGIKTFSGRSVLQRFTGDLDNNGSKCCSIESIVFATNAPPVLNNNSAVNWSLVDYNYFLRNNPQYRFECPDTVYAFKSNAFRDRFVRLDDLHALNLYNMSGYANNTCQ